MSALWGQLPSLIALAAHVAICVTAVSLAGAASLWICRGRSAPLRHAMALSFVVATLVVPAIAALYQYRLLPFDFASPPQSIVGAITAKPNAGPAAVPVEEPVAAGTRTDNGPNWSFIACAALALIWGTGIAIGGVRTLLVNRRQRQYLASLCPVSDAAALELARRLRVALGIGRHVQLRSSRDAPWPFTVGLFRPSVVIPGELLHEESRSRLEAVLIHELAHVRRLDCGVAAIEELAHLIYWWNPLISMLTTHLAAAREEICDGYVLAHAGDGASLAKYLIESAEKAARHHLRFAVGFFGHDPGSLRLRITQLLAGDDNAMIRISSVKTWSLLVATIAIAFAFAHSNYATADLVVGIPVNLGPVVNSPTLDVNPEISTDGLTLYFETQPPSRIVVSRRISSGSAWSAPVQVAELNGTGMNPSLPGAPTVTDDDLLMFFYGRPTDNTADWDIYQATRTSVSDAWGQPVNVGGPLNSAFNDRHPGISGDGLTLYFSSNRYDPNASNIGEALDIYMAQRTSRNELFGTPVRLGSEINSDRNDAGVDISSDGLLMVFHSTREGIGDQDIFYSERTSITEPWGLTKKLGATVNGLLGSQGTPSISSDRSQIYFMSSSEIFVVDIIPEPSTLMMLIAGSAVLGACLFTRRRNSFRRV